jgi:hypothetical protein
MINEEKQKKANEIDRTRIEVAAIIEEHETGELEIRKVGEVVRDAFEELIATIPQPISTNTELMRPPKRIKNKRPDNWKEIADHYIVTRKVRSTMVKFNLAQLNPNAQTWSVTLNRWRIDLQSHGGKYENKSGRTPSYGWEIDNQLAPAVKRYNEYGIPLTDHILNLTLIDICKKKAVKIY